MSQPSTDPSVVYGKDYYDNYGKAYYDRMCAVPYDRDQPTWKNHFQTLAKTLVERYHPHRTMDVGCAKGFLVEHLRDAGVEAFGVDISPYAISQARNDLRAFFQVANGAESLSGQFDLITCIEVAEHMPEADARRMIADMCQHTDHVIFSSTNEDFEEPTHINMHPEIYWVELFRQHGFYPDAHFCPGFITPQAKRFLRCTKPKLRVSVFSHEPPTCAVALLRLAGIIQYLEHQKRMELHWCVARDPQLDIERLLKSDIFVFQREFADRRFSRHILASVRELGKPIVFELDDLLINVPESNPNHKYCQAITPDVLEMLREADFVTVTTEPLKKYLAEVEPQAKDKTFILPNYINLDIWDGASPPPEKAGEPFVIGWFGTATHDEDLAIIKPAIVEIARKYAGKVVFRFWGYLPKDLEGIPGVELVRGSQPNLRLHARDLVNSRIDLALAPLLDHPFNHAKSDLKWLEYSICYVPAIYSPISPYTNSVKHGCTGWLAENKPEFWLEAIEILMRDNQLRRQIAIQAHDEVRQSRCVDTGSQEWDALYRAFQVSGCRPKAPQLFSEEQRRDRATAHAQYFAAELLASQGLMEQAAKACESAIEKWVKTDSSVEKFISTAVMSYRRALQEAKGSAELNASLKAASALADAGVKDLARQFYITSLQQAQDTRHPPTVLHALIELARAFKTLDPQTGNQFLKHGFTLAKSIGSASGLQTIEKLRLDYQSVCKDSQSSSKTDKKQSSAPQPAQLRSNASFSKTTIPELLVSIIIPTHNRLDLTKACLQAIEANSPPKKFELIVVDNASTDGTQHFLTRAQTQNQLSLVLNEKNAGFARACNQGAAKACGKYLLFLNNDTEVVDGWMDTLLKKAELPGTGVTGARLLYTNGTIQHAGITIINGIPDHPHRHAPADFPEANETRELDMVTGACLITPSDLFKQLGGFDEVFCNGVEDVDYCLRVRAAGQKVIYEPKAVVYHHEGQTPGRFNHVSDNLNRFFSRWRGWFDKQHRFIVPTPPRIVEASQSLFTRPQAVKTGAAANPIAVDWVGSFLDHGSLSHVNRSLLAAFKSRTELRVKGISTSQIRADGFKALEQDLQTHASPDVAVTVRHSWPPNWGRPTHGRLVVIQPWEFGMLPKEWVDQAPQVDEFWVPTRFVKDCYAASGIPAHKVFVVPNGVDAKLFHPGAEARALATTKRFKFLFVGGTIGRKGPDLLLQAYLQNFSATDDVCLVIKDFGGDSFYAGQTFDTRIRAAQTTPGAPEILYIKEEMPPEDLPGLYTACQCLVLPYRGEGFGLPVLEAMACGLPVIVTAGGATDDFVRSEFGWQISAQKRLIGEAVGGMKLAGEGWMLEPEIQEIGEAMRKAFGDPTGARDRGLLASRHVHDHFTWNHAAEQALQRIRVLARAEENRKDSKTGKSFEGGVPATARVGNLNEARKLFGLKKPEPAWKAACAAISPRPFHPEGWLLLAEIAAAQGDGSTARACAQRAREMAPGWNPPRQFLNKPLRGNTKLDWIKPPTRSPVLLTVCLIARNEERFLGACLKSIQGLNAQIIVVDTGSTDRTVEIARDFGAEVYSFTWSDDFAAARNAALEHARGDWVLMLDADEELPKDQHAALMGDIAQAKVLGYRLPLVNIEHEAHGRSHVPRLFRNMPGIFYTGRIHEQIFPSLMPHTKAWGLDLAIGTAQITHHGYTRQMMVDRDKIQRNLRLLQLAVLENPMDVNLLMNLGLEWVRSGDLAAGVDQYRKAFHLMTAGREDETAPELREVLLTQFTSHLYKMRHHEEVVEVLNSKLVQRGGLTASLHFAMGLAHFELKQFAEAAAQMQQCIRKRGEKSLAPVNTDIHTTAPEHCLALSLARKGDAEASEKCFLEVLGRTQPQSGALAEIKLDYARFLTNQNRGVEAFHKLHELVAANSKHLAAWQFGAEAALTRPEFLEFGRDWTTEAVKYAGEDFTLHHHRAEILMLLGENATAAVIWERLWSSERQPGILAALILCELINGKVNHAPGHGADEPSTSRAFIKWYQKLISMKSFKVVARVNESLSSLQGVLPNAAAMLQKALEECQPASR